MAVEAMTFQVFDFLWNECFLRLFRLDNAYSFSVSTSSLQWGKNPRTKAGVNKPRERREETKTQHKRSWFIYLGHL